MKKCVVLTKAVPLVLFAIFFIVSISISSFFILIGTQKENILKQQFIECNSIEHINEKYQTN